MSARADLAAKFRAAIMQTVERLPVSITPDEGTWSAVDDGDALGNCTRRVSARFRNGRWVRPNNTELKWQPTYWVRIKK